MATELNDPVRQWDDVRSHLREAVNALFEAGEVEVVAKGREHEAGRWRDVIDGLTKVTGALSEMANDNRRRVQGQDHMGLR